MINQEAHGIAWHYGSPLMTIYLNSNKKVLKTIIIIIIRACHLEWVSMAPHLKTTT